MSQRAYCLAIRDHLQNIFGLDRDSCDVGLDGQPKPIAGQKYFAIHPGSWTGASGDNDLEERFGVYVTVSIRLGAVPQDRWGTDVLDLARDGLEATLREINAIIHKSYFIMNMARHVYLGMTDDPFVGGDIYHPLIFVDGGRCDLKGPDWFSSQDYQSEHGETWAHSGVAQTLTYAEGSRGQKIFPPIILSPPENPYLTPIISAHALPAAQVGAAYSQAITATSGRDDILDTYTFALVADTPYSGPLPIGLTLSSAGLLAGTPAAGSANTYRFRVSATDPTGFVGFRNYLLVVAP